MSSPSDNQPAHTIQTKQDEEEFDYGEEFFTITKTNDENKDLSYSPQVTEDDDQPKESEDNKTTDDNLNKDLENSALGTVNDEATQETIVGNNKENEKISEEDINKETVQIETIPSEANNIEDFNGDILPQVADVNTVLCGHQESSDDEWDELQLDTQKSMKEFLKFELNNFYFFSVIICISFNRVTRHKQ